MSIFWGLEKERCVTRGCPQAGAVDPLIINLLDDDDNEEENQIVQTRALSGKRLISLNSGQTIYVLYGE